VNLLPRLRVTTAPYPQPERTDAKAGWPSKYGARRGLVAVLTPAVRTQAKTRPAAIYGARPEVVAADEVLMLETLRCRLPGVGAPPAPVARVGDD
jgi:hypothetical protein